MVETVIERAERAGVKVGVPVGSKNREDPIFHLLYERAEYVFTACGGYAIARTPPANARWCRTCLRRLGEIEARCRVGAR